MPLIRFDVVEGRSPDEIKALLDAAHRAMVTAFRVPERDRYQVFHAHPAGQLVVEDTGLGIERTLNRVVVTVVSRPRSVDEKKAFYLELCRELNENGKVDPADVVVSIVTNSDADWSFGYGRPQFLTGEL